MRLQAPKVPSLPGRAEGHMEPSLRAIQPFPLPAPISPLWRKALFPLLHRWRLLGHGLNLEKNKLVFFGSIAKPKEGAETG